MTFYSFDENMEGTSHTPYRPTEWVPFLGSLMIIVGLFYSPIALSWGMMLLGATALFERAAGSRWPRLRPGTVERLGIFSRKPIWWAPGLILVAVFISGLWSEGTQQWLWFSRLKLPLLVLPLAFCLHPGFRPRDFAVLEVWFVALAAFSTLAVLFTVASAPEGIVDMMKRGQAVPTPTHHIRYSMLLAFGALLSLWRLGEAETARARWWYGAAAFWLTAVVFLLATRTGVLVLGGGLLYLVIAFLRYRRTRPLAIGALVALPLLAAGMYLTVPTIQAKVDYWRWDLKQWQSGQGEQYSDSERLMSLRAGYALWREAPLTGTGMGDLKSRTQAFYRDELGRKTHKLPHNQWLFVLASTGLIGGLLFTAGFFIPFVRALPFRIPELVLLHIVFLLAGMVEHTLETTTGITFYAFFLSFYVKKTQTNWSREASRHD